MAHYISVSAPAVEEHPGAVGAIPIVSIGPEPTTLPGPDPPSPEALAGQPPDVDFPDLLLGEVSVVNAGRTPPRPPCALRFRGSWGRWL